MRKRREISVATGVYIGFAIALFISSLPKVVHAEPSLFINEISAGLNGDSRAQFVEIIASREVDKLWGPQEDEVTGRVMLVFYNSLGQQSGRFVFDSNAPAGEKTVLVATSEITNHYPSLVPDFIMPDLVQANVGKVCIRNNTDNAAYDFSNCISYGGPKFKGSTENIDSANSNELSILNVISLGRTMNVSSTSPINADYQLVLPSPSSTRNTQTGEDLAQNQIAEVDPPKSKSLISQGEILFFEETFLGNGRTCGTCHHEQDSFGLSAETVANLPDSNPLFIHEQNVNRIVVNSVGSINPSGHGTQPSDFRKGDVLTGSLGGRAKILSGSGSTFYVIGGNGLNIANNLLSDSAGNKGTIVSFTRGNLNGPPPNRDRFGLESSQHLRGGRALIVSNVDGFDYPASLRGVPSLLGTAFGRGVGHGPSLSNINGDMSNIRVFTSGTVKQHFTKSLDRIEGRDFRNPSSDEVEALNKFILSLPPSPWIERFNNDLSARPIINIQTDFAFTEAEQRGAQLFGHRCRSCHAGWDGGSASDRNTKVSEREINTIDQLPTEQIPGRQSNSRTFFTTSLIGLRDSAPYFHDNSSPTLEDVVLFYQKDWGERDVSALATFLRNIRWKPFDFTERVVDLGFQNLDKGPSEPKTFSFINTSDKTIVISDIQLFGQRHSSGPFPDIQSPKFLEYNFLNDFAFTHNAPTTGELLPGETIEFEVVFDPTDEVMNFEYVTARASIEFDVLYEDDTYKAGAIFQGKRGFVLDRDQDGFDWDVDNCSDIYNPSQSDVDGDGRGDVCDDNADGDVWANIYDNCPLVDNDQQLDFDNDGLGDACDLDDDNDGLSDIWENSNGLNSKNSSDASLDNDKDGFDNLSEFEFGSDPNKYDHDLNNNNVPDTIDRRRKLQKLIPTIILTLG